MKKLSVGLCIFVVLVTVSIASAASDVGLYYWLFKRVDARQTSTGAPTPTAAPYHLFSLVEVAPGGQFMTSGIFFTPPAGSGFGLQRYSLTPDGSLEYDTYFSTQGQLDGAFIAGQYQLQLSGGSATYSPLLNLTANTPYSVVTPKLNNTNFNNGQLVVDAAAPVTLSWNSFSDHDSNGMDVIVLIITNGDTTLFRGVLPANTTSKTFAANFFKKEESYTVDLSFVKVAAANGSIAGSIGLTGYAKATQIFISTSKRTPLSGLGNISTRGLVGTGDNVLICGFIITSTDTAPLTVVIRAIGPSLALAGITNPLLDPTVDLFDGQGHPIASSDDWRNNTPDAYQVYAAGLNPSDNRESALYRNLVPGSYTAIVRGKNNTTGVALAEVYNLGSNGKAKLANISTRGQVLTAENILIGGVIIKGPFAHSVLLRALGPSLGGAVAGALQNPTIQLVNSEGSTIGFNNDWRDTQEAAIQATGHAPTNDKEAAILLTVAPGAYSALVRSKNTKTGVALVEAYAIN